jgi:hypothetical protein
MIIKKNWFWAFAIVVYVFFTASSIGPGFSKCTDSIYGFGDSTAGPIWKNSLKPEQPILGGYEDATNYPKGESLYSPVGYASLIQSTVMKATSEVVGPVCAYNLYNIFGYLSTSLVMFAFILYLTKNRWIGLLAGYAVGFTPYVQSKIGGHPSYGYAALLIAILWLTIHLIAYRRKRHAVALGIVLAICAYFDPYFILLAMTVVLPILAMWTLISFKRRKVRFERVDWPTAKQWLKPFVIAVVVFAVLVTPLVVIRIKDAGTIDANVGAVRGNVIAAAMLCSNTPIDYLLPDPHNIHLVKLFGLHYTEINIQMRNWCGDGESRVSISLILMAVIAACGGVMLWDRLNKRRLKQLVGLLPYGTSMVVGSILLVALAALLLGLPPYIDGVITPSGIVLKITQTWRIFAREYLVLNLAVVVLAAIALKYFTTTVAFKNRKIFKAVVYIVLFLGITAEYQINIPFQPMTFSYSRDIPEIYGRIRDNPDINVIAEYPIDRMGIEHDSIVYYMTMQAVHGKKMFNSAVVPDSNEDLHIAMKDLTDPQTIPALRALGIKYIVIHGEKEADVIAKLPNIQILAHDNPVVYALTMVRADTDNDIILAKILDGPQVSNVLTIKKGYLENIALIQSPINIEFDVAQDTELKVKTLEGKTSDSSVACFDIRMDGDTEQSQVAISVNGQLQQTIDVNGNYMPVLVTANPGDIITIHNGNGHNMRLNNLGCVQ